MQPPQMGDGASAGPPIGADRPTGGRLRLVMERMVTGAVSTVSVAVALLTVSLVVALLVRSLPVLGLQSLAEMITGTVWHPLQGKFGFWPFIVGTLWVTVLAMLLATPACILTAIYLAEYAATGLRAVVRPMIDVLAGIPSVVYGLFGVLVIVPLVRDRLAPAAAEHLSGVPLLAPGKVSTGYCVLAAAVVLALMVTPVIISVAEEVLRGVSRGVREASLSLGATRWETVKHVSFRIAMPGLIAAVVLGFARAFGETMAVLMVAGNVAQLPGSLFDPAYPLPALIANNYGEMMSIPLYDSALMLGALILLVVVLIFNLLAELVLIWARRRSSQ